jgi:hypothetical protein
MRAPICIREASHEVRRIRSFHGDMPTLATHKCLGTDYELLSFDLSFDLRKSFIERSRVANKTVHHILFL